MHLYLNNLYIGVLFIITFFIHLLLRFMLVEQPWNKFLFSHTRRNGDDPLARHVTDDVRKRPLQTTDTGDSFPKQELNFAENEPLVEKR